MSDEPANPRTFPRVATWLFCVFAMLPFAVLIVLPELWGLWWYPLAALLPLPVGVGVLLWWARHRAKPTLRASQLELFVAGRVCPKCGYNMKASPRQCSECGWQPPAHLLGDI